MTRYSKRRSRRGSRRKRRGGNLSNLLTTANNFVGQGAAKAHNLVEKVSGKSVAEAKAAAAEANAAADAAEVKTSTGMKSLTAPPQLGGRRGGSGRCCFPAKFCGSRKRKGNKRRSIRSGRCCLPVKSKKCGARKKSGRKTKKSKRKRGMFQMFGGG